MPPPELLLLQRLQRLHLSLGRPIFVALDGGSGAGKSTLSERLGQLADVALIPLDDFYQTRLPEAELPRISVPERLHAVFEWDRVRRDALEPLRAGRTGRWHAFDFSRGLGADGRYGLREDATDVAPATFVVLEGAYSASPFLRDLIDLAVLVHVPLAVRHRRIAAREHGQVDSLARWHAIWDDVEHYYFSAVCPPASFDLVLSNDDAATSILPAQR